MDTSRWPKLARSGMRSWTIQQVKRQGGLCPLCGKVIDYSIPKEAVIDHDHDTGEIRGILHRSCNAAEGKVANAAGRWGAKSMQRNALLPWLKNLVAYYEKPGLKLTYYTHKTPEEKLQAQRLRAAKSRASKAKTAATAKARRVLKQRKANAKTL